MRTKTILTWIMLLGIVLLVGAMAFESGIAVVVGLVGFVIVLLSGAAVGRV